MKLSYIPINLLDIALANVIAYKTSLSFSEATGRIQIILYFSSQTTILKMQIMICGSIGYGGMA